MELVFLTVIGVWQIILFFLYLPYKMMIEWNDLILLTYLPFIVVLQLFRLLKIKKHKKGVGYSFLWHGFNLLRKCGVYRFDVLPRFNVHSIWSTLVIKGRFTGVNSLINKLIIGVSSIFKIIKNDN